MSGMNRELIAQVTRTGAICRLLQLAEYGYWAPSSDSMLGTEDERALIGAELVERHPSPWSGQMRATTTGARLASKIVLLVRDEMERQVYAPESNDLNVGYQAGRQDSEAWTLLKNIVSADSESPWHRDVAISRARDALERRK